MPDGTLICWGAVSGETGTGYINQTFPHEFISTPRVTLTASTTNESYIFTSKVKSTSTTTFEGYTHAISISSGVISGSYATTNYIAVGKWKQVDHYSYIT